MNHREFQKYTELQFLKSALTTDNPFSTTEDVLTWLRRRNEEVRVNVERIPFAEMNNWQVVDNTRLQHSTGKFFSIEGIRVETNWGNVACWDQPIINQPEVGLLGIITKEFNNVLYFLMQAKIEPGNINNVQLSPTIQSTKSNYTQVHKGKKPAYLEYFQDKKNRTVLLDQLQSEQGARFLKKRNRNIIIKVEDKMAVSEDFCWLTLGQIIQLVQLDNVVNMDTRTVISGIQFGTYAPDTVSFYNVLVSGSQTLPTKMLASVLSEQEALYSFDQIIHWFTDLKAYYDIEVRTIPLHEVAQWTIKNDEISHEGGKYFKVIGVNVEISNREVSSWHQPLIAPWQEGLCAFVIKEINGLLHFLVQAKVEAGNFDILEMAPTVQCITGSYDSEESLLTLPFLEYVLTIPDDNILFDTRQSEEGGRFYREQNRNLLILADATFPEEVPDNYLWMTLNQLKTLIKFNNYLNIQARSLIAAIAFV